MPDSSPGVSSAAEKIAEAVWRTEFSSHEPWSEAADCERVDVMEIAQAVIAAIRAMSAEDQAALIGGEVEEVDRGTLSRPDEYHRPVGPWRPSDGLNPDGTSGDPTGAATDAGEGS